MPRGLGSCHLWEHSPHMGAPPHSHPVAPPHPCPRRPMLGGRRAASRPCAWPRGQGIQADDGGRAAVAGPWRAGEQAASLQHADSWSAYSVAVCPIEARLFSSYSGAARPVGARPAGGKHRRLRRAPHAAPASRSQVYSRLDGGRGGPRHHRAACAQAAPAAPPMHARPGRRTPPGPADAHAGHAEPVA